MLKAKIHRATVTQADLNYVGSITIDRNLLKESHILVNEKFTVVNINNGARFDTYAIEGESDSGVICVNGAAARLVQKGDKIIIIAYCYVHEEKSTIHRPRVLFMDEYNKISSIADDEKHGEIKLCGS